MATTYVTLVNKVLTRMNEVNLDTAGDGFDSVRNVQALAKEAVNSAVRMILQDTQEWPFLKTTQTKKLTEGTRQYDIPADMATVDWDTFYVKLSSFVTCSPQKLPVITYEDYLRFHRSNEELGGTDARTTPSRVYQTEDLKFGVTPLPDDAYEVEYRYWSYPTAITAYDET